MNLDYRFDRNHVDQRCHFCYLKYFGYMEAEHLHLPWGHALRACVMLDFGRFIPHVIPVVIIRDCMETLVHLKVRVRSTPPACEIYACFGQWERHC